MRKHSCAEYLKLKARSGRLVEELGGGVEAAKITRVSPVSLCNYSTRQHEQFMPVDVMFDLEAQAGEPILSSLIAEINGAHASIADVVDPITMGASLAAVQGKFCQKSLEYAEDAVLQAQKTRDQLHTTNYTRADKHAGKLERLLSKPPRLSPLRLIPENNGGLPVNCGGLCQGIELVEGLGFDGACDGHGLAGVCLIPCAFGNRDHVSVRQIMKYACKICIEISLKLISGYIFRDTKSINLYSEYFDNFQACLVKSRVVIANISEFFGCRIFFFSPSPANQNKHQNQANYKSHYFLSPIAGNNHKKIG